MIYRVVIKSSHNHPVTKSPFTYSIWIWKEKKLVFTSKFFWPRTYCVLYWTRNRNLAYFRFSEWWHRCLVYPVILVFLAVTTHFQGNFFFYIASSASNIYKFLFLLHMAPIFQRIFMDKKYSSIPKCFKIWVAVICNM